MDAAQIERIGRYRPLLVDAANRLWVARGYTLFCSQDKGDTFHKIAAYDAGPVQKLATAFFLSSRLLRAGFHGLRVLPSGDIVAVVKGGILRLRKGHDRFDLVHRFERGSRPLNICATPAGDIFYGEYWGNPDRDEVRIMGSCDGGLSWKAVYTFPRGAIRHVHGIHNDPHRGGLWILTGDGDNESRIIFTDSKLDHLEVVATGNQRCRAVTVMPMPSGVIVPTDTEHEQNYIQWLDTDTGKLERITDLPGTVFYATRTRDRLLLSTVVEPSEVNLSQ